LGIKNDHLRQEQVLEDEMKHKIQQSSILSAITIVLLVACSPSVETPLEPTATPKPVDSQGDLVIFGDSAMWYTHEYYSKYYQEELGVPITVYDKSRASNPSSQWIRYIGDDTELRELISMAEIIAFNIPLSNPIMGGACFRPSVELEEGCFKETADEYAENTSQIIKEIKSLVDENGAMIILQSDFMPVNWWLEEDGLEDRIDFCLECFDSYYEAQAAVASEEGILFIDVLHALNGEYLDENPADIELVGEDGIHVNDEGAKLIAELYQNAGFEIWVP
jgi:hypothetical protein